MTTVLSLLQDAAADLSLTSPPDIADTTGDLTTRRLLRHLHTTCRRLAGEWEWHVLRREGNFATVASTSGYDLPSDFQRLVPDTMYNRTQRTRVAGPLTPDEWQAAQAVLVTHVFDQFCIRGSSLMISPTPSGAENIYYEYITKNIGTTSGGTAISTFTADSDVAYFDDELLILGVVWRYRKSEGLDYSEEFAEFERRKFDCIKMEGGRRVLDMNSGSDTMRVPVPPRVPETLVF